jgi:3-oxoacyl-[acyl-carrier protein] reductase
MNINLSGKNALVCGSTQGIGLAAARALAQAGAKITLLARNAETLAMTAKELPAPNGQVHDFLVADFADTPGLEKSLQDYLTNGKVFHILVNNTGGPASGPIEDATTTAFLSAFTQHLIANQILVKAVKEGMKKEGFGRIINVISTSVKVPLANLGVSNTVRGAVASWAKTLATELGKYGITVNNVLPGATETGRLHAIIANKAKATGETEEQIAKHMVKEIPAGRFGKPDEIGAAICFLASESASYINGINLPVDGGRTGSL